MFPTAPTGLVLGLAVAVSIAGGCGPGKGAARWIGDDAAIVRCTVSGNERLPGVLLDLPLPQPPTQLYANLLDPLSLDKMGYQRDQPACATLIAPDPTTIERTATSIPLLLEVLRDRSGLVLRAGGDCRCAVIQHAEALDLIPECRTLPVDPKCTVEENALTGVRAELAPIREQLAQTTMLPVHWRLAGITDRPGWFVERLPKLFANHRGGSEAFLPGTGVSRRGNHELLRGLLELDDVVAVVRQDGGRSFLVAREVDGRELVLDHFAHPQYQSGRSGLIDAWDNTHLGFYVAALETPATPQAPGIDVRLGNLAEVRRGPLARVDDGLIADSQIRPTPYSRVGEQLVEPPAWVDVVTLQAPSARPDGVLAAKFELSPEGATWAGGLPDAVLSPTLDEIPVSDIVPSVASPGSLPFAMRGQPVWSVLLHGIHGFVPLMRAVEMAHPGTIAGKATAFEFNLPPGPLLPDLESGPGIERMLQRLASGPHQLSGEFNAVRDELEVELSPR